MRQKKGMGHKARCGYVIQKVSQWTTNRANLSQFREMIHILSRMPLIQQNI